MLTEKYITKDHFKYLIFSLAGDDQYVDHLGPQLMVGSIGRLVTPRSSAGYTVDSAGDSDEEETERTTMGATLLSYNKVRVV